MNWATSCGHSRRGQSDSQASYAAASILAGFDEWSGINGGPSSWGKRMADFDYAEWQAASASWGTRMSDTRVLLGKITELRQRLAQVQGLVGEASRTAAALLGGDAPETADAPLDARIADG